MNVPTQILTALAISSVLVPTPLASQDIDECPIICPHGDDVSADCDCRVLFSGGGWGATDGDPVDPEAAATVVFDPRFSSGLPSHSRTPALPARTVIPGTRPKSFHAV